MLCDEIENFKKFGDVPEIPLYITENLKYPLYEWQKSALENFLINEKSRVKKSTSSEKLPPNHLMFNMATGSGKTLVMAALILYYYKHGYRNFIFFVNQNAILGKTQANFIDSNHIKYLFTENVRIDGKLLTFKEVQFFSSNADDDSVQIKFTTIQKLHNDIYKESEDSLLLSDLQKRDLVLIGDEAHHMNAMTSKKKGSVQNTEFSDFSFTGELKDSAREEDIERSWENTVCHHILNKSGKQNLENKNVLLEFTATIPENEEVQKKYENKIIIKFALKEFVEAGFTKHIRLVRSNLEIKERILQALLLNWYRYSLATKEAIANFKPVILFRSKTIDDSWTDYKNFLELCKNVTSEDFDFIEKIVSSSSKDSLQNQLFESGLTNAYSADEKIFDRIDNYIKNNGFSYSTVATYIKENFGERNVIITNSRKNKTQKEKTDGETDRLLNCLEDFSNHIRAIFTVQRLTEGWDVLNLYDIVRLYSGRDTDFKTKKAGSSTTSEVQLIGRGVRYFPFEYKDKARNSRKFDNDLQNELRILEEFYFYSDDDVKYISELSTELKRTGIIAETRTQKVFRVKDDVKKDLEKLYLFVNKKIENPDRKLKTLPEDFKNLLPFEYKFKTSAFSRINDVNFNGEDDESFIGQSVDSSFYQYKFSDFKDDFSHIYKKALHILNANSSSYFSFENLRKRFSVKSTEDFFDFIKDVKINITSDTEIENVSHKELLKMFEAFFVYCQNQLESYDRPFKGTDFSLVPFASCFDWEKEKLLNIDETKNDTKENKNLEKEICSTSCEWYALDNFWGTSEERNLICFIKSSLGNLKEKYEKVCLLRNEEVYKIFAFDDGQGFAPDFLLLLKSKNEGNAYFQIFIEPKGEHLAGDDNDGWKEKFLEEISERYGLSKAQKIENKDFVLYGLPFFNETNAVMKKKFVQKFKELM